MRAFRLLLVLPLLRDRVHRGEGSSFRRFSRGRHVGVCGQCLGTAGCVGPRPSEISARESGVSLVCQPWSAWYFCIAVSVCASHWPLGEPVR